MPRPLTVEPVDATFGAVVTGFRIAELDDNTWQELHATWLKYALLIFPGQYLTRDQQIAFAKRFGPLEFEMSAISNVKEDGMRMIEQHGPFEIDGDVDVMRALDDLLASFVVQQRMKLPGSRYVPCYRIRVTP